ncbi:peptidylprolyl isomerase [Neisseria sp. Ec49-e6-T10]|uniref:peptidylprolyl isomerase n=1 Tax=Neisseria sp. Ec49-e6-T10 TaxID=3140744 RepID=UPI003EC06800
MAIAETLVTIQTNQGNIDLSLDEKKAPITVRNFVSYAQKGFYDGTIFHRVIDGFMIQGGGFDKNMKEKATDKPIINEATNGLKNTVGTIAMARTNDPNSASSQFFINVNNNDFLNHKNKTIPGYGYAVFGKVTKGMDVVNKIAKVKTASKGMYDDVPVAPVIINKVVVRPVKGK